MVSSEKEKALQERMERLGIRETDIIERFVRSGATAARTSTRLTTCVYLKHLPTGLEVKCQQERYQAAQPVFRAKAPRTEDQRTWSRAGRANSKRP